MTSVVHYKFKNASKTWATVMFEGAVISVLDLKRAIVEQKKLTQSTANFDLSITDAQTGEGIALSLLTPVSVELEMIFLVLWK